MEAFPLNPSLSALDGLQYASMGAPPAVKGLRVAFQSPARGHREKGQDCAPFLSTLARVGARGIE